jgi:hypothetical protein
VHHFEREIEHDWPTLGVGAMYGTTEIANNRRSAVDALVTSSGWSHYRP